MGAFTEKGGSAIYKLKLNKQGAEPAITKLDKVDGEWTAVETHNSYVGRIEGVELSSYEYKDKKQTTVKFYFSDNGQPETLEMNLNFMAISILNTLANEENLAGKTVGIRVWNGDPYGGVMVTINGEKGQWKLQPADVKKTNKAGESAWIKFIEKFITPQFEGYERTTASRSFTEEEALTVDMPSEPEQQEAAVESDELPF